MNTPQSALKQEIEKRLTSTKKMIAERGYDALVVYGNNKVSGSLRYLTDYFPDRAGWISLSATDISIVDGAAAMVSPNDETTLLVDPGLMPTREICVDRILGGSGFSAKLGDGLSVQNLVQLFSEIGQVKRVGIETFDKFPAPILLGLMKELPTIEFVRSTIVEELRLIKSEYDISMFRGAAKVADLGHRTMVEELINNGVGKSELDLIRQVEDAMRRADPMYEDSCSSSPSLICSGGAVVGTLLHNASHSKIIESGDIIHWDIAMRFEGYPVDTSRTRAIGKVSDKHHRCYEATMEIQQELFSAAKPGILASDLTNLAEKIATKNGYELWNRFIGHGLGWDVHERPDMGTEELPLEENMVLAIEPRLTCDDIYLLGNEDMTLVTNSGGVPLTEFPKEPLELS